MDQNNTNWVLSDYDRQRKPHLIITDNTVIAVTPRSLHSELMCPICLDMLKNTRTTKECLHRFCQECITTALRSGNKECPTCRKKLVSKRSLRPDPNFDALIEKIYPSRVDYEAHQNRVIEKLTESHKSFAFTKSLEEGKRQQGMVRKESGQKRKKQVAHDTGGVTTSNGDGSSMLEPCVKVENVNHPKDDIKLELPAIMKQEIHSGADVHSPQLEMPEFVKRENGVCGDSLQKSPPQEPGEQVKQDHMIRDAPVKCEDIELIFRPHPDHIVQNILDGKDDGCQVRFIKTSPDATIDHLTEYLIVRNDIESMDRKKPDEEKVPNEEFYFYIYSDNQYTKVVGDTTLNDISKDTKMMPLELHYINRKYEHASNEQGSCSDSEPAKIGRVLTPLKNAFNFKHERY